MAAGQRPVASSQRPAAREAVFLPVMPPFCPCPPHSSPTQSHTCREPDRSRHINEIGRLARPLSLLTPEGPRMTRAWHAEAPRSRATWRTLHLRLPEVAGGRGRIRERDGSTASHATTPSAPSLSRKLELPCLLCHSGSKALSFCGTDQAACTSPSCSVLDVRYGKSKGPRGVWLVCVSTSLLSSHLECRFQPGRAPLAACLPTPAARLCQAFSSAAFPVSVFLAPCPLLTD